MVLKPRSSQHRKLNPNADQRQVSRRSFWQGLLLVIAMASMVAGLLLPKNGQAQAPTGLLRLVPPPAGIPVADAGSFIQRTIRDIVDAARYISDKADKLIDKVSKKVGDVAFKNALKVFLGKIAEDTATWVASSGRGQQPLFAGQNYFKDLGSAAAGDYLDSLSKEKFGVSLCDPGAFKVTLDIALRVNLNPNFCKEACQQNYAAGLNDETVDIEFTRPSPAPMDGITLAKAREAVADIQIHWPPPPVDTWRCKANILDQAGCLAVYNEAIARGEEKLSAELKQCNSMCSANKKRLSSCTLTQIGANAKQGLLGSGLTLNGQSTNITGATLQQAYKSGDLPQIFRPDQNPLGMFLTQMNEAQSAAEQKKQQEKDILTFNSIFPLRSLISGNVKTPGSLTTSSAQEGLSTKQSTEAQTKQTGSPVADAFGIFTNTLTSKLIQRIFSKGLVDDKGNPKSFGLNGAISQSSGGAQAARDRFASLSKVSFGTGGGIDILNELSACPVDASTVTEVSLGIVQPNNCVLDPLFRQAIDEHLTVKEALQRGLLSDKKTFGFDANGREPDFRNGYPYRSLVLLRKYRIIPVGWELAAEHIRDFEKQNVNLRAIVSQFDDPTSAYYRLVDPSWVLKAPENICLRTGFTNSVVTDEFVDTDGDESGRKNLDYTKRYCASSSDANQNQVCECDPATDPNDGVTTCIASYDPVTNPDPTKTAKTKCTEQGNGNDKLAACAYITPRERQVQRREACVDEQTCILENDDGTCKQYGTCVEERDAWRFNGQTCNEQYASCATFTEPAGTQVSYLQNTLQPSVCGPSNAGCQQYCSQYNYTTNTWACTEAAKDTRRFDRDLQSCDPSAEGCTQFIRQTTGTNLVPNAGFELGSVINPASNMQFDGWRTGDTTQTCGAQTFASTDAMSGSQAARLQWVPDCGGGNPAHTFTNTLETGTPLASRTFTVSFNAKSEGASCLVNSELTTVGETSPSANPTVTPEWQRFSYSYTFQAGQNRSDITLILHPTQACTYLLDNVQVEEGTGLTDYKDYGAVNLVHLKQPPSEPGNDLKCTGNSGTDPAACSKFIAKCTKDDFGCDLFTPVIGGINVPAKPGQSCPADKVGCASFREQPTSGVLDVVPERTGYYCKSDLPTKFTSCDPALPTACSSNPADCEPLVSFIGTTGKQCTAQDVGCEAFTNLDEVKQGGEGKAQFTKLQQCVPPAPAYAGPLANYYAWVGSDESGYQLKKFTLVPSNVNAQAPCTNLGHDLPLNCQDNLTNVVDCQADFGKNPDCSQYYDEGGNITYRLRSRVIEQTADCHPYRNEVDSLTYYADSNKSLSCSVAVVGCREYVGNTGSNTRTVISSDFENGSYAPWATGPISTESVNFGGHSLRVTTPNSADVTGTLRQGGTYLVSFWAKADASASITFGLQATSPIAIGTASVTTDWNTYSLGPVTIPFATSGTNLLTVSGTAGYFLDNVVLTEVTDSTFKIKASQTVCGGYEGCAAYRNRAGQVTNLMSFSKLCQADKVGCEALINTQNSSTPFAQTITLTNLRGDVDGSGKIDQADLEALSAFLYNGGALPFPFAAGDIDASGDIDISDVSALGSYLSGTKDAISSKPYEGDTVATGSDVVQYWVNDPAKACNAEDKGCRTLGKQQVNLDAKTYKPKLLNTETVYAKDNPDAYPSTLCGVEALSCEEYGTADGGKAYFRNPTGRTCEYRDATGNNSADWYVQGTNERCPIRNQGNIPPAVPTGGFAGLCPAEQNGCGTFLDPLGTGESLATNSGFEIGTPPAAPQNWTPGGSMQEYFSRGDTKAVRLTLANTGFFNQTLNLDANTYYVVSADVEHNDDLNVNAPVRIGLVNCRDVLGELKRLYSPDKSMVSDDSGAHQEVGADRFTKDSFLRISGRVYSGDAVTCQVFAGTSGTGPGHWFDNLQVRVTTNSSVLRQSVDSTSCNGQVGDKLGCHLFNDTSNTGLVYDVDQSPIGAKPTDADATGGAATCASNPELCDSNIVLKVSRDRTCSQWLAPTTTIESTKPTGQKENLVLGLATCDRFSPSGQCDRFVDELRCSNNPKQTCVNDADCGGAPATCKPMPLTGNTQAYSREDLRNKSGLVVAGLQFGRGCSQDRSKSCAIDADCGAGNTCLADQTIKGKFPFGIAPQVGNDGISVTNNTLNGDFSNSIILENSGWTVSASSSLDGSTAKIVTFASLKAGGTFAPVQVNPYVELTPSVDGNAPTTLQTSSATLASRLTPERQYMLSFSARYLQAPDAQSQETLSAGIATNATNGITTSNAWFGKVSPTTTMQRFVLGPLKLSASATLAQGNIGGTNHASFDSGNAMVYFSLASGVRAAIAIDDVSLLPALQIDDPIPAPPSAFPIGQPNGQAFVSRSCRAYPNSSALTCSYTDDTGKLFNGWQGYCLEVDPQNSSTCLNWYPVDLLAGERNIFGNAQQSGYTGRSPLFACVESSGNYSTQTFHIDYTGPYSPMYTGATFGYRRPITTHLTQNISDQSGECGDLEDKGCRDTWIGQPDGSPGLPGLCGCDENVSLNKWVDARAEDQYYESEIERIDWIIVHGSYAWDWPQDTVFTSNAANNWRATWSEKDNSIVAQVEFDTTLGSPTYGRLKRIYGYINDGSPNKGGAHVMGLVYLREWCTQVVQVVGLGGANAAWSGQMSSPSALLSNFRYNQSQDTKPFGTIAQPEANFDTPELWDGGTSLTHSPMYLQFGTSDARSATTYGCIVGRECAKRQCISRSSDPAKKALATANHCTTLAEIANCSSSTVDGYCVGSTPVRVCIAADAPKAVGDSCTTNADCGATTGSCDYANSSGNYVNTVGAKYTNRIGTETQAQEEARTMPRLRLLFADVYKGWTWNRANQAYDSISTTTTLPSDAGVGFQNFTSTVGNKVTNWQTAYDTMTVCKGSERNLLQAGDLANAEVSTAYCGILPEVKKIRVGQTESSDVFIQSGELIQLKFNTTVDKQQLPLKNIAIDWDGNDVSNQIVEWGFAPQPDLADPHSISHVYRYGEGDCHNAGTGPYATNANVAGHAYCVVRPQVQVRDNWDWCNFSGTTNIPSDGRCANFPVDNKPDYWEQFGANIIIIRS